MLVSKLKNPPHFIRNRVVFPSRLTREPCNIMITYSTHGYPSVLLQVCAHRLVIRRTMRWFQVCLLRGHIRLGSNSCSNFEDGVPGYRVIQCLHLVHSLLLLCGSQRLSMWRLHHLRREGAGLAANLVMVVTVIQAIHQSYHPLPSYLPAKPNQLPMRGPKTLIRIDHRSVSTCAGCKALKLLHAVSAVQYILYIAYLYM